MAAAVATPLEKQFSTIAGIDTMTSTSTLGSDPDHAAVRPRPLHRRRRAGRPGRHRGRAAPCRRTCPTPPSYRKVNPADPPVSLPRAQLADPAALGASTSTPRRMMAQRISMVSGVAQVQVFGAQKYAVRVQLDPSARRARHRHRRGRARRRATATSTCRPARSTAANQAFTIEANGQLQNAAGLPADDRRLPQRRAGAARGARPRLDGVENDKVGQLVQRRRARSCSPIQRQPGTNTVEVVDAIKELLPDVPTQLPAVGAASTSLYDRSSRSASRSRRAVHAAADARRSSCW